MWTLTVAYDTTEIGVDFVEVGIREDGKVKAHKVMTAGGEIDISLSAQDQTDLFDEWKTRRDNIAVDVTDLYDKVIFGPKSGKPTANQPGGEERFYIETDGYAVWRDTGTIWELLWGDDDAVAQTSQRSMYSPFPYTFPFYFPAGGPKSQRAIAGDHTH